jgi:hypothetical protein
VELQPLQSLTSTIGANSNMFTAAAYSQQSLGAQVLTKFDNNVVSLC